MVLLKGLTAGCFPHSPFPSVSCCPAHLAQTQFGAFIFYTFTFVSPNVNLIRSIIMVIGMKNKDYSDKAMLKFVKWGFVSYAYINNLLFVNIKRNLLNKYMTWLSHHTLLQSSIFLWRHIILAKNSLRTKETDFWHIFPKLKSIFFLTNKSLSE